MKISILSSHGKSLSLAQALQNEGYDISFCLINPLTSNIGEGIVPIKRKLDFEADLIINDNMITGTLSDKLRKVGKLVLGGSEITDKLANDRIFGRSVLQGIKIPLPHLEEIEESGIILTTGGWFNGARFCKPPLISFNYNHLMPEDKGPEIKEMGVVLAYRTHSRLFYDTLIKSEAYFRLTGYKGYIGLRCLIIKDKAYGLEWITGFDYPALFCQQELHDGGKLGSFLYALTKGTISLVPADTSKWCVGISCQILPPYTSLRGIDFPKGVSHIHLRNVKWEDRYYPTDEAGSICVITAKDVNLKKAKEKAYKEIEKIDIPHGFYRSDIGESFIEQFPTLKKSGWVK